MSKYVEPKDYISPAMKKILDSGKSNKASDFSKSKSDTKGATKTSTTKKSK